MSESRRRTRHVALSDYYNASQYRLDTWNRLKSVIRRLRMGRGKETSITACRELLDLLEPVESYWAFPGNAVFQGLYDLLESAEYTRLVVQVSRIVNALMGGLYRRQHLQLESPIVTEDADETEGQVRHHDQPRNRPYFEVLFVDEVSPEQQRQQTKALSGMRQGDDDFIYEPVFVPSFEDGLIAVLFNYNIQAVVIRYGILLHSAYSLSVLTRYLKQAQCSDIEDLEPEDYGSTLVKIISRVRPELDLYLVTDQSAEELAGSVVDHCRRVFYHKEDLLELHLHILSGITSRYQTPFFSALRHYAKQPTGVFHALPISRGKSITKSNWIRDMIDFYGMNIFLAETSATSGGLDSLLEPHGPIKKAHELASRAYGSRRTFFATNGTSTCNKIVVQALVRPGDIVLVDRDCHKSHHYGMVLSGAHVVYLDSYPLHEFSMYGAVPLREIKRQLLALKNAGKLPRVKMLLLTNCTFDGIVYDVQRVMEECLAIKPDLVFLWDEAWFGFASFGPTYRQRTAMYSAAALRERYASRSYAREYAASLAALADVDEQDPTRLETHGLPDPARVRVRVYATQSTHKTLTALRQGSMIHIHDQDYKSHVEESFHEAFMTHTSTSPNYQILASLDIGRRQVELEGFELVQKQVEMAMSLRSQISSHPLLSKYFRILRVADMIPASYRQSGIQGYFEPGRGWNEIWEAWENDEFCLDATRLTLYVAATGLEGDAFKNEVLMNKYGIQVNKTSKNTVLFMTNIGSTRSSVAYLIESLVKFAHELERNADEMSPPERCLQTRKIQSITRDLPPLPDFSRFHDSFRPGLGEDTEAIPTDEGLLREAFFLAYDESCCEYLSLEDDSLDAEMDAGRDVVSANFVIPYPPGFPILVPGQVASPEIIEYLRKLDVKEIHGFRAEFGLRVFTEQALAKQMLEKHTSPHQEKKA